MPVEVFCFLRDLKSIFACVTATEYLISRPYFRRDKSPTVQIVTLPHKPTTTPTLGQHRRTLVSRWRSAKNLDKDVEAALEKRLEKHKSRRLIGHVHCEAGAMALLYHAVKQNRSASWNDEHILIKDVRCMLFAWPIN